MAANIIRRAMIRMDDALAEAKLSAKMLLQVHDELVFEAPPLVSKVMEPCLGAGDQIVGADLVDARAAYN